MTQDEQAIRELVATWMAASKRGDTETVLSLMADDLHGPGARAVRQGRVRRSRARMTDIRIEGTSEIQEIEVIGDRAFLRNRLTITVTPEGGEPLLKRSGYTLSILRRERDGRWVLIRDANLLAVHESFA